jgi:hypothetical protein
MRKIKLQEKGSILKKVFRALGKDSAVELPFSFQEEKTSGASPLHSYYAHEKFTNALLEAERKKAEAIEWFRRKPIC